tara:strand:- start:290 stop:703 length:414 start_codon:yes stop_codon:yes gene_type:complete
MVKKWVILLVLLLFAAPALAIPEIDISESFGMVGEILSKILLNEYAVFLITIIIGSIMIKGVVASSLMRIPSIEASGHVNSISWSLSLLIVIAFVWGNKTLGVTGMMDSMGSFRYILFILLGILLYQGIRNTLTQYA